MTVSISFLGGLGEVGRNCAAIEIEGRLALIDCGLMFPEEHMLGIDLVLPNFSSVFERADDVECVVLTHGHEDHIGALSYFLSEVNVPIYGTPLAVALAAARVEENGIEADLRATELGDWVTSGPIKFQLIQVSHSVPQGAAIAFDTPEGIVVHSGDFKLDPTPIDAKPTDLPAFAELGQRGVRLLLADSTNAERPGFIPSESSLRDSLRDLVAHAEGRVVAACFASHLHRVEQIVDAVVDSGRSFAFLGRSMHRNTTIARDLGIMRIPEDRLYDIEDLLKLPPHETAIICTGSQGEPFAALSLMAAGEHRWVDLQPEDTVVISATPIPGNEKKVSSVINGLLKRGVTVHHGRNANVHVSGHAAQEELKTFINVVRPQAYIPVHGEYRHLRANADLATAMAVPQVVLAENGDGVVLDGDETRHEPDLVDGSYVFLDGSGVGDIASDVLRDRRHLADDGVVVVTVGIASRTGEILVGPDLDSHGLTQAPGAVLRAAKAEIIKELEALEKPCDADTVRRHVRDAARRVIRRETERRPVVVPVVVEV
ncbi:MAG: ribonuclease J [Acidimicrobiia bacterium]|nr:ribonuclease J [Acidimicrobiia bacterium]